MDLKKLKIITNLFYYKLLGDDDMSNARASQIAIEAAKILYDNPNLSYKDAINKAKELMEDDEMAKMEKTS